MVLTPVEIRDAMAMALSSIRTNKLRSFLTILGVMIGVSSVIGLASVVNGLDLAMDEEIDSLGSNIITITKYPIELNDDHRTAEDRNRPPITVGEAEAIAAGCPSVDGVSPQNYYRKSGGNDVKYMNRKANNPSLMGVWHDYVRVHNVNIGLGRFLTENDEKFRQMNCVIGADVADALFEGQSPIGREIRVNQSRFTVVGVFEKVESNFDNDGENSVVAIPLSVFEKMHPWEEELFLVVKAASNELIPQAMEEIISALRIYRQVPFDKPDNFALSTQDNLKEMVGNITKYIYLAMIVITSVGLLVGGIGVMNIMLVSVTERTREIGIRKAVGAKRINIILQFLTEAMTMSGAGGVVGVVFGIGIGLLINLAVGFPLTISIFWVVVGFVVAVSVGLVSGVYPAVKAALLDPIDALRYE